MIKGHIQAEINTLKIMLKSTEAKVNENPHLEKKTQFVAIVNYIKGKMDAYKEILHAMKTM